MQFSSFITALMVSAVAPLAMAAPMPANNAIVKRGDGNAYIHNNCAFDISVNPCFNGGSGAIDTIPAGQNWTQPQQNFGGFGQGVSLKVNQVGGDATNVAQFEYTINNVMGLVFYDLSLINGNPFGQWPQLLTSTGTGPDVSCAAGETPCAAAYTWAEQVATKASPQGSDLHYFVCSSS